MNRTGQGHFTRAFRKLAKQDITILRPASRSGKMASTAKVIYELAENFKCVWVNKRASGENAQGGEKQIHEHWLQIKKSDLAAELGADCRVVKGTYIPGDTINKTDEWMIMAPGPDFSHGSFSVINITVRKPKRGSSNGS